MAPLLLPHCQAAASLFVFFYFWYNGGINLLAIVAAWKMFLFTPVLHVLF
jgi:hypothetical protein